MLTETFTVSTNSDESNDEDSDDDVIFCSETFAPPKKSSIEKKEPVTPPIPVTSEQPPDAKKLSPEPGQQQVIQDIKPVVQPSPKPAAPVPKVTTPVAPADTSLNPPTPSPPATSNTAPQQNSGTAVAPVQSPSDAPSSSSSSSSSSSASSATPAPAEKPVTTNQSLPKLQPVGVVHPKSELILDADCISSPPPSSVISVGQPTITHKNISFDGVQKKQVVTVSPGSSSKPGEFKIKIADVVSGSSKDSSEPRRIMDGKKIITLDTASEIEGLSTGCKVYANIGEDTYDIVIPIKDDPEEGLANLDEDGLPDRKKMKLKT
ncbi:unnamed protein product [Staurois parvus]|uniref:Uncharacterized protein n=1 Tax=Staurois parvus TaxID=386267 RepID=A0ABN9GG93_9NEOB|nr:unnamed protein product [Staurois parvus]